MKKAYCLLCLLLFLPLFTFSCKGNEQALNEYKIVANFNPQDMTLSCHQTSTYVNNTNNILCELKMFLYANSFEKTQQNASSSSYNRAYYNGESYGNITFQDVEYVGQNCGFELSTNHNILRIILPNKLYPQEKFSFDMNYVVTLANVNHRLGYGEKTINFGSVFPMFCVYENGFIENDFAANGDPFYSDVSNYFVELSYPQNYILAATGIVTENADGKAIVEASNVRDFCAILSQNFEVISDSVDKIDVNYFFYDDDIAWQHLETAKRAISLFSKSFGEYPYKQISVVKTNFCFGGMEYPNLVMISDDLQDDLTYNYVIVHELAHQWWYGLVGNNEFEEAWLDESLTEYSSALFFEEFDDYGLKYDTIIDNAVQAYKQFVEIYTNVFGNVDQSMARNLKRFATEPEYVNCVYTKGVIMYDTLREMIGAKNMYKALKKYCKKYALKNASSSDFVECVSKTLNRDLRSFFNAWLNGSVVIK